MSVIGKRFQRTFDRKNFHAIAEYAGKICLVPWPEEPKFRGGSRYVLRVAPKQLEQMFLEWK